MDLHVHFLFYVSLNYLFLFFAALRFVVFFLVAGLRFAVFLLATFLFGFLATFFLVAVLFFVGMVMHLLSF